MFVGIRRRTHRRPAVGVAGVAAALVATLGAAPAHAVPTPPGVGGVRWEGSPVGLREVAGIDVLGTGVALVGQAVDFISTDPDLACLNGDTLGVYRVSQENLLIFSTAGNPDTCVDADFEPIVDRATEAAGQQHVVCLTPACVTDNAMFRAGQVTQAAFFNARAAVELAASSPNLAGGHARGAVTGSVPEALAGTIVAQVESLTDLYGMRFHASLTNLDAYLRVDVAGRHLTVASPLRIDPSDPVGCLIDGCPVVTYTIDADGSGVGGSGDAGTVTDAVDKAGRDPSIDPAQFVYWGGLTPYWEDKNSSRGVYGAVIYNVWRLSRRVSNTNDFFATTQSASVTPQHKSRLTKLETMLQAKGDGFRLVEASPLSVQQSGEGETVVLNATLQGNVSAKPDGSGGEIGGSFGVARSYTKPLHNHGGGMDGPLGHFAHWSTGDNGSGYSKEAAGVETWTLPIDYPAKWGWWAHAWWCNDPCGP